ncbi:Sulfotransferase family protein [compost metagenome]
MQSPHHEDRKFFKNELSKYNNFDDFIDSWLSPHNIECWKHFYPQHKFIFNDNQELMIDFVGRVEDMNSDINRLNKASGLNLKETHENKTENKEKSISKKSTKKIEEIYKLDFELLGY